MIDLKQEAETMTNTADKVEKILRKLEPPTAVAVINFLFLKIILNQKDGPVMAKAMAAIFLGNVMNSIDAYYYGKDDEEPVH